MLAPDAVMGYFKPKRSDVAASPRQCPASTDFICFSLFYNASNSRMIACAILAVTFICRNEPLCFNIGKK